MFLLVDKPKGMTSHDVIDRVRRITGERKVGHAGTLDPNATGLLIVAVGRESTKMLGTLTLDTTKGYWAEIVLGEERDTDDVEGEIREISQQTLATHGSRTVQDDKDGIKSLPSLSNIDAVIASFEGEQEQLPPAYSAIKLKGKKAYELARQGKIPELKSRRITIHSIEVVDYKYPKLTLDIVSSAGTYIRSIARDLGRELGVGGYLHNLRRTSIGEFHIDMATKLEDINSDNWKDLTHSL